MLLKWVIGVIIFILFLLQFVLQMRWLLGWIVLVVIFLILCIPFIPNKYTKPKQKNKRGSP